MNAPKQARNWAREMEDAQRQIEETIGRDGRWELGTGEGVQCHHIADAVGCVDLAVIIAHAAAEAVAARLSEAYDGRLNVIAGDELLAMIDAPMGSGHVVLFGMRPQYRGQSYQTFKLFFNSLLY